MANISKEKSVILDQQTLQCVGENYIKSYRLKVLEVSQKMVPFRSNQCKLEDPNQNQ